jgi:hypothetical protein
MRVLLMASLIREAIQTLRTPRQLRFLFVHLLINNCVPSPLCIWNDFLPHFHLDFLLQYNGDEQIASSNALQHISQQLEEHGFSLTDFGLPEPHTYDDEILHELLRWNNRDALREGAHTAYHRFNLEQRDIYDTVMHHILCNRGLRLYIDGKAGRGKTFLVSALCNATRSLGKIVLATATSAFAAQLYPGGRTTHSTFKASHSASPPLLH